VLGQMRCAGVLEVCRIRRFGFPFRLAFAPFATRYWPLAPRARAVARWRRAQLARLRREQRVGGDDGGGVDDDGDGAADAAAEAARALVLLTLAPGTAAGVAAAGREGDDGDGGGGAATAAVARGGAEAEAADVAASASGVALGRQKVCDGVIPWCAVHRPRLAAAAATA